MKTNDLTRRNFLFGTVAAAAAGTALTIVGKDVQLFQPTLDEIVSINRVQPQHMAGPRLPYKFDPAGPGDTLYNADGVPVAIITSMYTETSMVDATSFRMDVRWIGGGVKQIAIEVEPVNKYLV